MLSSLLSTLLDFKTAEEFGVKSAESCPGASRSCFSRFFFFLGVGVEDSTSLFFRCRVSLGELHGLSPAKKIYTKQKMNNQQLKYNDPPATFTVCYWLVH